MCHEYSHVTCVLYVNAFVATSCKCIFHLLPIGCLIFIDHFPQKSPTISGSFVSHECTLYENAFVYITHAFVATSCKCKGMCNVRSCNTGWRRHIGCHKLQVIFRKRATNYRAFSREMSCKDKVSYGSPPPCNYHHLLYALENMKCLGRRV